MQKGFTLIELLVMIAILSTLAWLLIGAIQRNNVIDEPCDDPSRLTECLKAKQNG